MAGVLFSSILLLNTAWPRRIYVAVEAQSEPLPGELRYDNVIDSVSKSVMASDLDDSVLSNVRCLVVSLPEPRRASGGIWSNGG